MKAGGNIQIGDQVHKHVTPDEKEPSSTGSVDWEQVYDQIKRGRIKPAIDTLIPLAKAKDADLYNEVIQQSERWNRLQGEIRLQLNSRDDEERLTNRIVKSLIMVVDELKSM